ncbi:MAG: WecB/TagA/CpsF family glycosyltransferase [Caulobacterales bacterium]|nr:WecB/TagA/CpsF family glycosyltransferase [Caulobacterales bacterium]
MANPPVIEGIRINLPTPSSAVTTAIDRSERGEGFSLFTLNLDHLVKLRASAAFRRAYASAGLVSADGAPIVWLARRQASGVERTTGADLVEPLMAEAARRGVSVYVVGPGPDAQGRALSILVGSYPGLRIAGAETPMVPGDDNGLADEFDIAGLAARINASDARLCLLCLGAPKQELLADALRQRCPSVGFLGVGASLDFIAGEVSRAPRWMQVSGLEWSWRLFSQPKRLGLRYARCALLFAELATRAVIQGRQPTDPALPEPAR